MTQPINKQIDGITKQLLTNGVTKLEIDQIIADAKTAAPKRNAKGHVLTTLKALLNRAKSADKKFAEKFDAAVAATPIETLRKPQPFGKFLDDATKGTSKKSEPKPATKSAPPAKKDKAIKSGDVPNRSLASRTELNAKGFVEKGDGTIDRKNTIFQVVVRHSRKAVTWKDVRALLDEHAPAASKLIGDDKIRMSLANLAVAGRMTREDRGAFLPVRG